MAADKKVLVDFASAISLTLQESSDGGKFLYARGEFGRADVPTQNRRTYPRKVWQREINRIQEAIKAGKVLGHLEHPSSGKTSLERVSHIITGLEMMDDGTIVGEAKILNNEFGRQLRSILEAGGAVGVSSRGLGSTMMGEDGHEVVQDDYSYMTHDFVADPAVITSYPKFQTEVRWIEPKSVVVEASKKEPEMEKAVEKEMPEKEMPEKEDEMSLEAIKKEIEGMLKGKEAKKLLDKLVDAAKEEGEKEAEEEAKEEAPEAPEAEAPEAEKEQEAEMPLAEAPMLMGLSAKLQAALDDLKKMTASGVEYPDAEFRVAEKHKLSAKEIKVLSDAYLSESKKAVRGEAVEGEAPKKKLTVDEFETLKKQLKEIGYKVRTKQIGFDGDVRRKVSVIDPDGNVINDGNAFSKEFLEKHQKAFDLINKYTSMMIKEDAVTNTTKALAMEEIKKLLMPFILPEETDTLLSAERTKVESLTKKVAELTESVEKLGATCNRLGVALYFEKNMKRMPETDQAEVTAIVGDLKKYEDVRTLEKAVMEAKKIIGTRRLEESAKRKQMEAVEAKLKALEEAKQAELSALEERNKKLEAQLKESLDQAKALGIRVYLEERVKDHPNAATIRKLCEGKATKEEVDAIVKRHSVMPVTSEDYNSVRRRFDKFKNTQLVESHVKETAPAVTKRAVVKEGVEGEMADLFPGVSLDQVKNLM